LKISILLKLFFTGGKEDKTLGFNPEAGRFFTNVLIAIVVSASIISAVLTNFG
jgi:hypothetical protein